MKNKTLVIVLILLTFSSCKKDDDTNKTTYIHITTQYDSGTKGPEGTVLMFDLTENKVTDFSLISAGGIYAINDVNREYVFPIYNKALKSSKNATSGLYINESQHSIFSSNISSSLPRDFLIVINIDGEPYSYTYKKISWGDDNIELNKTFNSQYSGYTRHYEIWN